MARARMFLPASHFAILIYSHFSLSSLNMASQSGNVCDFKLAAGQTAADVAAHSHTHDEPTGEHSHSHGGPGVEHGHTHEIMEHPGKFAEREVANFTSRDWEERAFTVGIGG